MRKNLILPNRSLAFLEIGIILLLASIPLFNSFPYRVNIFLSWEGAYRMSQGEMPFRDFGMPLGGMYWVIPAIFFKVFGTQMITLIKAQVFINILSGLAFRSILRNFGVQPAVSFLSVLLFCISYSFFNFWPWYNHTVIVYELIALAFLSRYMFIKQHWIWLVLSGLFTCFSFFTKQDGGALAFLICMALLITYCLYERKWLPILIYGGAFAVTVGALVAFFSRYNFGYWFNHGQPPHTSRFSVMDIVNDFFLWSQWMKFYLFLILVLLVATFSSWKSLLAKKNFILFLLLTIGIIAEAAILQVTSYTPPDNNIFYHSFAFAFIFTFLGDSLKVDFSKMRPFVLTLFGLLLWWSGTFWKYAQRLMDRVMPAKQELVTTGENIVNKKTYVLRKADEGVPESEWIFSPRKAFRNIYMPRQTVEGIERLLTNPVTKKDSLRVLNMSELTPLAAEMPFELEKGADIPLWYHLGVAMFNKGAAAYEQKITQKYYDLILFENIPSLNNFYPFRVRDAIQASYQKIDSFVAPRRGDTQGIIEVYVK